MKTLIQFLCLCLLLIGLSVQAQQITTQVTFSLNDMGISQSDGYDIIGLKMNDVIKMEENPGSPQLPASHLDLLLPKGAKATNVTITVGQQTQLQGTFNVYPVQPTAYPNFSDAPAFVAQDPSIYSSNTAFPTEPLVNYTTHNYREYSYVGINFIPFSYQPQSGKLHFFTNISITVSYTVSGTNELQRLRPQDYTDKMAYHAVQKKIVNPQQLQEFYNNTIVPEVVPLTLNGSDPGSVFEASDLPSVWGSIVSYVIITNNTDLSGAFLPSEDENEPTTFLTSKFQQFADWKTRKGTPAKVVTVDAIRAAYPGGDVPEKIRNFIKDAHQKWGTEYVLLGGSATIVPVRWIPGKPTDLYYAALGGNWNDDGNTAYGDNNSDFTADIAVGRAPVDTKEEAENFLKKNFAYARCSLSSNPVPNGAWLHKQLMAFGIAYPHNWEDNIYSNGNHYNSLGLKAGYDIIQAHHNDVEMYGMFEYHDQWNSPNPDINHPDWSPAYYDTDPDATTQNGVIINNENLTHVGIIDQINQGYGFIDITDHGGPYRIGLGKVTHRDGLVATDFEGLNDTGRYPIMMAGGCHTAAIERDSYIGERWVNAPNAGVAFLGNSANIGADLSFDFNRIFFDALLDDNHFKLGWLPRLATSENKIHKLLQILGDPDLSIYTKAPTNLTVTHANYTNSITLGQHTDFDVQVSGIDAGEQALVSVYKEGEVAASAYVENNETITFNITPDTQGNLQLTVTAHNKEPYEETIPVTQPNTAHLYKSDFIIDDNTFGNGNGIIEPGEKINLSLELSNTGGANASGISAVLSSGDPDFTISIGQNTSDYPDIASGTSATENTTYTFTAPSSDDLRAIPLLLTISTSGQGEFKEPFLLNTKSSDLQLGNRYVTSNANNYDTEVHIFNTNDEVHIAVTVNNQGLATAENVTGELSTGLDASVASVNSNSPVADYGDIDRQDHSDNTGDEFIVNIGNAYNSGALPFTLTLTDGFGATKTFDIDLAEAFPDFISNFNYTSSNDYIKPTWDAVQNIEGYNVYRSDAENGTYEKVNNFLITTASVYEDLEVEPLTEYWYKISIVSPTGNEGSLDELMAHLTQTKLANHGGFPIAAYSSSAHESHSSPTVYDIDGDGTKEIFMAYRNSISNDEVVGRLMGFKESGEELFDIDGSATDVYGFAETEKQLYAKPAVGDLEGDGQAEVIATGRGFDDGSGHGVIYGYRTTDQDSDGKPDVLWQNELNNKIYRNPVLADLDNDGYLEILVLDEHQKIHVYDHEGNAIGEKQIGSKDYSEGQLAVADIDNDGYKEIVLGVQNHMNDRGAIYIWNPDDTLTENTADWVFIPAPTLLKEFGVGERADNGPVLANIDSDPQYEVLIITRTDNVGKIYAINIDDETFVNESGNNNWNGSKTIELTGEPSDIPRIAVGDLNNNGQLEVAFGSKNKLYVLKQNGEDLNGFPITGLHDAKSRSPILADIDDDDDIEIIMNETYDGGGSLKAFNPDGTECTGWNLIPDTDSYFTASPYVGDIDNDNKNEVVISSSDNATYVWDTTGDADKVEWGSYRHDAQNTGAYEIGPCVSNPNGGLDLMVKDTSDDVGNEPNNDSETLWNSGDIWVRNQNDGKLVHETENPEYDPQNPNYVYVRVYNNSCEDFHNEGNTFLKLHWAKANSLYGWPELWNGGITSPALMGDVLSSKSIPDIPAGGSTILEFEWYPPNPGNYGDIPNSNQFHFCLLARILSPQDPMTFSENSGLNTAYRNNNIASRNITVVDLELNKPIGGSFALGNITGAQTRVFDFEFVSPDVEPGSPIWQQAEVLVTLDQTTWDSWNEGGRKGQNLKMNKTGDGHQLRVTGNHAKLENIKFDPHQWGMMQVTFNVLTEKATPKKSFNFNVVQRDSKTQKLIGGETFLIHKPSRDLFYAKAGDDRVVDENESTTISAEDIDEPATYNWYDPDGNLIYTGKDLTIAPDISKKYKLEIIADADGYKDYDDVEVKVGIVALESLVPNPAATQVTVNYKVKNSSSAYLILTSASLSNGNSNNYILDPNENQITLDLGQYSTGVYIVSLVVNGEIVDSLNLLIE